MNIILAHNYKNKEYYTVLSLTLRPTILFNNNPFNVLTKLKTFKLKKPAKHNAEKENQHGYNFKQHKSTQRYQEKT